MRITTSIFRDLLIGLSLRGLGAVSTFALTWLIARMFGPSEVGLYQLGLSSALFLAAFVSAGLDLVLVREMGKLLAAGDWSAIRAGYERCRTFVLKLGIVATLGLALLAYPLSHWVLGEPRVFPFLLVFAVVTLLAPLLSLGNVVLRSTGRVIQSQVLEGVTYTTLACGVLLVAMFAGWPVPELLPAIAYVGATIVVVAISQLAVARVVGQGAVGGHIAIGRWDGLRIAALRTATQAGNLGLLMLVTALLGLDEAGVFRTAYQVCLVLQLVNTSFSMMAGPHLAASVAKRDACAVASQVRTVGLIGFGLCLPVFVGGVVFPDLILGIFGPEFQQGRLALQLLLLAQVVDIALGQTGLALVMMKREDRVLADEVVANAVGLAIAAVLVPLLGMNGAALGAVAIPLIRNFANLWFMRCELEQLSQSV